MKRRQKPNFWVTWIVALLAGEETCEYKTWLRGHYQYVNKLARDFDSAEWTANHTRLLNEIRREYEPKAERILIEDQTSWQIVGNTAILAGKMDIVTVNPNFVIDGKTGRAKDSHVLQVKTYLLALARGAVENVSGPYRGFLRYQDRKKPEEVDPPDKTFKDSLFGLVARLAGPEPKATPSARECGFCDLADCEYRVSRPAAIITTDEF